MDLGRITMANNDIPEGFELQPAAESSAVPSPSSTNNSESSDIPEGFELKKQHPDIPEGFQLQSEIYGTPGQKALTVAEHAAKGVLGPIATKAEQDLSNMGVPGLTNKDILAREQENPGYSNAAELGGNVALMLGLPEYKLFGAGAEGASLLAKSGSQAINNAIQNGVISAGDEYSKNLLGVGDPTPAVTAKILGAGAAGLLFGMGSKFASSKLADYVVRKAEQKAGSRFISTMAGIGHELKNPSLPGAEQSTEKTLQDLADSGVSSDLFHPGSFKDGQKIAKDFLIPKAKMAVKGAGISSGTAIGTTAGGLGGSLFGPAGAVTGATAGGYLGTTFGINAGDKLAEKIIPGVSKKIAGPIILKMAASGKIQNLAKAIDHGTSIEKGAKLIGNGVDSIFRSGSNRIISNFSKEKDPQKLKDFQDGGGYNESSLESSPQQGYAEGGEVEPQKDVVAEHWPDQNILLTAAKTRISNYLKTVKPQQDLSKLTYDQEHKDKSKEKEYDNVIRLANNPISILEKVKDGTLSPKDMAHFTAMFPEVHDHLSKKITEKIIQEKLKKQKNPPYKTRQALSLFLGSNLDSSLTQPNVMAAQSVFMQQNAMKQNAMVSKMGKSSKLSQTKDQGSEERLNKP